ncbi:MAG: hypothetical protein EWM51_02180 [Treponema sp.]|nr:MAG: hypothetical protein EWM51_02180 [Treponema sp.]
MLTASDQRLARRRQQQAAHFVRSFVRPAERQHSQRRIPAHKQRRPDRRGNKRTYRKSRKFCTMNQANRKRREQKQKRRHTVEQIKTIQAQPGISCKLCKAANRIFRNFTQTADRSSNINIKNPSGNRDKTCGRRCHKKPITIPGPFLDCHISSI